MKGVNRYFMEKNTKGGWCNENTLNVTHNKKSKLKLHWNSKCNNWRLARVSRQKHFHMQLMGVKCVQSLGRAI